MKRIENEGGSMKGKIKNKGLHTPFSLLPSPHPYEISYRKVKYPRLELKTGKLLLVLPYGEDPKVILKRHKEWIEKKVKFIEKCIKDAKKKKIIRRKEQEFKKLVFSLMERTCKISEAKPNRLFFRKMKTKWASCSKRRNLTINTLMKFLPDYLIEYIIFHEVTHLIEKRHNEKFWKIIYRRFKNYERLERELFYYWFLIWKKQLS